MCPPGGSPRRCTPRAAPTMLNSAASLGKPRQAHPEPRAASLPPWLPPARREQPPARRGGIRPSNWRWHFCALSKTHPNFDPRVRSLHCGAYHERARRCTEIHQHAYPLGIDRGGMRPSSVRGAVCRRVTPSDAPSRRTPYRPTPPRHTPSTSNGGPRVESLRAAVQIGVARGTGLPGEAGCRSGRGGGGRPRESV